MESVFSKSSNPGRSHDLINTRNTRHVRIVGETPSRCTAVVTASSPQCVKRITRRWTRWIMKTNYSMENYRKCTECWYTTWRVWWVLNDIPFHGLRCLAACCFGSCYACPQSVTRSVMSFAWTYYCWHCKHNMTTSSGNVAGISTLTLNE
jgi:hypothetical protein